MIERNFDISLIADMALREKQIQQNYRPIIAIHKWFARRPGTLFRGLLLAEFGREPLRETFFRANRLSGIRVADPFMGGGTPLIEANRLGCDTVGYDINPMAYWIVRQEIEPLDLAAYRHAALALNRELEEQTGRFYRTRCLECGHPQAYVKYFLWVKVQECAHCARTSNSSRGIFWRPIHGIRRTYSYAPLVANLPKRRIALVPVCAARAVNLYRL